MTPQAQALQTIRALKGPSLGIFMTMLVTREPASQRKLCILSGHSEKTVGDALKVLGAMGFVTRDHYRKWELTADAARSLPALAEVGDSPTSAPTTTSTEPRTLEEVDSLEESSESVDPVVVARRNRRISQVTAILRGSGIGDPMRARLASMDHITVAYARAHVAKARREETDTALLIFRMQRADPMPDTSRWTDVCGGCYRVVPYDYVCAACGGCQRCCACGSTGCERPHAVVEEPLAASNGSRDNAGVRQVGEGRTTRGEDGFPRPDPPPGDVCLETEAGVPAGGDGEAVLGSTGAMAAEGGEDANQGGGVSSSGYADSADQSAAPARGAASVSQGRTASGAGETEAGDRDSPAPKLSRRELMWLHKLQSTGDRLKGLSTGLGRGANAGARYS
jgi:hypothetical protein